MVIARLSAHPNAIWMCRNPFKSVFFIKSDGTIIFCINKELKLRDFGGARFLNNA